MATNEKIGDDLNAWRYPVFTVSQGEDDLQRRIVHDGYLASMNISNSEWDAHCSAVDSVLDTVLLGLKKYAREEFKGLIVHGNVRQGSSREGLRVNDALEFDCLVKFEIEGMQVTECPVYDYSGEQMVELIKLRVENPEYLLRNYAWLNCNDIFTETGFYDTTYYINTQNLQEKVFKSLLDKTRQQICEQLPYDDRTVYAFRRSVSPPTFLIRISLDREISYVRNLYSNVTLESRNQSFKTNYGHLPTLDIDFVPALMLRKDYVPNPYTVNQVTYGKTEMTCAVYAVMKWARRLHESERTVDHDYLWRESTCGYEKHINDVGRRNPSQRYVMTACRIVKSYVAWMKSNHRNTNQLHRVAVSYYLKNLCFHCIALLTVPSKTKSLSGVKEALGYFLLFLELCIDNRNLPHFFYGNPWVHVMFPNCSFGCNKSKKNLYSRLSMDTFVQAESSFRSMLQDLKEMYKEFDTLDSDRVGPFKELLGLSHAYRMPQKTFCAIPCSLSVVLFFCVIVVGIVVAVVTNLINNRS
ncbi:unnamed protein product [Mytilus coruscus]|uniref:Uncharacterized protein n=1 Tax=Mytilus coruscus TaxID=42192 RepID=A0A6J8CJW7_MYTCO|nr:unnamed protein product [Mytilus coruscus]